MSCRRWCWAGPTSCRTRGDHASGGARGARPIISKHADAPALLFDIPFAVRDRRRRRVRQGHNGSAPARSAPAGAFAPGMTEESSTRSSPPAADADSDAAPISSIDTSGPLSETETQVRTFSLVRNSPPVNNSACGRLYSTPRRLPHPAAATGCRDRCVEIFNRVETAAISTLTSIPSGRCRACGSGSRIVEPFLSDKPRFGERADELLDFLEDSPRSRTMPASTSASSTMSWGAAPARPCAPIEWSARWSSRAPFTRAPSTASTPCHSVRSGPFAAGQARCVLDAHCSAQSMSS